jgi:hypothetical protein
MILRWSPFKIVSVSAVLYPRWPPLLKIEISSNGQNCSILTQNVPKFELLKHNDELLNIYYGIFYELWTFADFDRLCILEKRGDEIKKNLLLWNYWANLNQASYRVIYHIVGSVFGPVRFLLPVCRLSWFLYTLNIHMHIFRHIFLRNYWWQKSDIWSKASYMYPISCETFLDPSDSYFLFCDFVDFYTHWTYMLIFCRIFLSNYWWQKSDIWSQASYRYPISWEAFLDPSDSYFLFADFVDFYTDLTYICICTFF